MIVKFKISQWISAIACFCFLLIKLILIFFCFRKGEEIPNGWGADKEGNETNNPSEVLSGGGLLPLGGSEISGGYKGLSIFKKICGIACLVFKQIQTSNLLSFKIIEHQRLDWVREIEKKQ